MSKHLEEIEKIKTNLSIVGDRLDNLSNALYLIGNQNLSMNLDNLSEMICAANAALDKTVSDNIRGQYEQAQKASANMINAALSVSSKDKQNIEE